tara:strand:- start:324 stop:1415 length:1092 start_codon:yes stop_codon:yes gene_type:complete
MEKIYCALGLMSGTSGDGVDSSVIKSDGKDQILIQNNDYNPYPSSLTDEIHGVSEKIQESSDLEKFKDKIINLEEKLTDFHTEIAIKSIKNNNIDIIGFHGQTIFHNSDERISKQIGDGNNLSKITKKMVVYDFRQNDIKNGGEGAPLAPIYHKALVKLLVKKKKIKVPLIILNIGGIANITVIDENYEIKSMDIGPGNCLIDRWIRLNSNKKFDKNGNLARLGKIDKFILNQSLDIYYNNNISKKKSLDTNDFDLSFARGLSLENGAATITEFTSDILSKKILNYNICVCGGGRKNNFLMERLQNKVNNKIILVDDLGLDGDFIESQAFAYLSIRSLLKLPISFPNTTGCSRPTTGGNLVKI